MADNLPGSRKARLKRRSVAAVLWALATLAGLQVAYHYPCAQVWPQLYDVEYGPKLTRLRAQLHGRSSEQPLVLAFGSSLTGMGLRPGELIAGRGDEPNRPLLFNYGIKSGLIIVQTICLRRLLAEGIHPDMVLLETYPHFYLSSASTDPRKIEHIPSQRLLKKDLAVVTEHHFDAHRVRKEWREGQCVPWYFHRNVLMNWYLPSWVPKNKRMDCHLWETDAWGWDTCPTYFERMQGEYQTPQYFANRREHGLWLSKQEFNEELHGVLVETVALCRREKIDVVMVWPPEASSLRDNYAPELTERCERWFARLHRETGAPLINARAWVDDANFADGMHLTPAGARDYTIRLEREVSKRLDTLRQQGRPLTFADSQ